MSIWLFQISNICCLLRWTHLFPAKKASPLVTTESPVSILKVLVFPAPLTPSRPKHWNGNDAAVSLSARTFKWGSRHELPLLEECPHRDDPQRASVSSCTPVRPNMTSWCISCQHFTPFNIFASVRAWIHPGDPVILLTLVSCRSSRMSPWPAPLTILCLSLATSSSSSPIGLSLALKPLQLPTNYFRWLVHTWTQIHCGYVDDTYLGLKKKLYWMRTVKMKKTTPSTAMANRFFPTMSHSHGERKRFSPDARHKTFIRSGPNSHICL